MSHARPRLGLHSLVLAIVMLLVGAAAAQATTVTESGDTLIVNGDDNSAHEIQFRLELVPDPDPDRDHILDNQTITSFPGDCEYENAPTNTWISCPGHGNLQVNLGAGNDDVTFVSQGFDCFNAYDLNLGDGANELNLSSDCGDTLPGGPATVNSGSGPDVLTAGSQGPITFNAGGGNDSVYASPGNDLLHGGEGDDRLFGYAGNDQVLGEGGADQLNGGSENDNLDGGAGDDGLEHCSNCIGSGNDPGVGADTYIGGPGADRLWLDGHGSGMAISIDGQANDGSSGEGDNVGSDIEAIAGTVHNDVFNGSAGPDNFEGGGGNDEIHGGAGNDDLYGGSSDDRVFGDAGNDKVQGASGADGVDGGAGTDQMYGDIASCSVFCSLDSDTMAARDGERDTVDCGGGADSAVVDQLDVVAFCVSIDRANVGQGGGPAKASFAGSKKTVKVSRTGRFTYSFRAGAGLRGKAVFGKLATKSFKVPSSGKVTLKVTLARKKLALLRKKRKIRAKVTVTLRNAAGATSKASKTVTFKR
jgi:Ca2+-binding RTX toxin-like protein